MPKVSIIMPIYNAEKYLREAMNSAINQTLRDIEIICINDGSTDKSSEILDEYAQKDNRIIVIHKTNSGYGHSMNIGIQKSSGEYIGILEPDDYISLNMMGKLYYVASKNNLDIAKGNFAEFTTNESDKIIRNISVINNYKVYNKVFEPLNMDEIFLGYIINPSGIYKKSFIDRYNIKHNETPGASYQDLGFWFQLMIYAKRMLLINDNLYFYRKDNPNSSIVSKEKVFCICDEFDFVYNLFKDRKEILQKVLPKFYYLKYVNYMFTFRRIDDRFKLDFLKRVCEDFNTSLLDYSFFSDSEKLNLQKIINNPASYCDDYFKIRYQMRDYLNKYDKLVIYGAGNIGRLTLERLLTKYKIKVIGFAVTSIEGNDSFIEGIEVREIKYYLDKKDEILVIVSVAEKYQAQIINLLKNLGYKNFIISPIALEGYCG